MRRRDLLKSGLALPVAAAFPGSALGQSRIPIADMHFHSFFGSSINHSRPVGQMLAEGGATLVSWSVSGDGHWIDPRTLKQTGTPKPGEALRWVEREIGRIKAHMAVEGLKPALGPRDVDAALDGEARIVLAVEGASFIESDPARVKIAYDLGVRHLQLVHYIAIPLGDFQTEPPHHNGLTGLGKEVVAECNRLGVLIDLAHMTTATLRGVLAVSRVPTVWSHSSVTSALPHAGLITWRARQLPLIDGKAIAAAGGVVGLWVLRQDIGPSIDDYARRLLQMADWLGDEHVAFGTDINGLGPNFILKTYAELRQVIDIWQQQGVPQQRMRNIAGLNYARVLKAAMRGRRA